MNTQTEIPTLASLEYLPYLNENGQISEELPGKIGVYAIFDENKILQYVGYSRDIYLSLKQHLVRQIQKCYWLKILTIERPRRTFLEEIRDRWIAENNSLPVGNGSDEANWNQPIDAKVTMTEEEKEAYQQAEDIKKIKLLKNVARRLEAEILEQLKSRNVQMETRFNPKLKEQGLLDLK
ncbi:MAG: GIY-YIG nuclease family protein [Oscillatoria sp. PMC 1051.18]|uniref:GIY-YIG nuclease family protein n=1 Tax=Oscillatoria salina TaxID=331517 RepID=UPI0013B5DC27|nr:GIY-YIG nuclease family protein [Oscillatoria salina]MBZ8183219.1 GIY-YIG nuclease family protein [Oscillatoria salina IIICB1]MEC4894025.1 GIY-YIG nuclease family protein [Oscillatoria sp. PMC 1050.18]MEC5032667.1 GIY-YIG nuclease family protein [Oscillatoria sp. PMC 1051.18]NET88550.1 GIY-YIG nuclease family protein [Kamptonema sp. SIO1D9]